MSHREEKKVWRDYFIIIVVTVVMLGGGMPVPRQACGSKNATLGS